MLAGSINEWDGAEEKSMRPSIDHAMRQMA